MQFEKRDYQEKARFSNQPSISNGMSSVDSGALDTAPSIYFRGLKSILCRWRCRVVATGGKRKPWGGGP